MKTTPLSVISKAGEPLIKALDSQAGGRSSSPALSMVF